MSSEHYDILETGHTRCGKAWGQGKNSFACYMIYSLEEGRARLEINGRYYTFVPGPVYFFSGYHLGRYGCDMMRHHWLHIAPTSFALTYALQRAAPVHQWKRSVPEFWKDILTAIDDHSLTSFTLPQTLRLHAFIQDILSRVAGTAPQPFDADDKIYRQLTPAIIYMDQHFHECPSLDKVAQAAALAPNYFHRLFKQYCGITPYRYMLDKRMSHAQYLLVNSDLPIKAVAEKTGYPCPFHFAKIFHQYFGQSPSQRRSHNVPFLQKTLPETK